LAPIGAQQSQPVFRSGSALIEVDAVVTGRNGAIVRGLTRDDFVVTDNGKPQEIVQFSFVDLPTPASSGSRAEIQSDVVTNSQSADGRLYAILLDAFHVDPSRSTVVRKLARQFIETEMGPNDMAAVVQLGPTTLNQPFTSDKALLIASIEKFIGRKPETATSSIMRDALLRPQDRPAEDRQSDTRANETQILLESVAQLCRRLGIVQGRRRSVLVFGEGVDHDTSDLIGGDQRPGQAGYLKSFDPAKHAGDVLSAEAAMLDAARRANVALYTIDPRGGTMGDEEIMQAQTASGANFTREAQRGQGTLRTFASETGGFSVVGTNDFKAGFSRIVQANSSYYVLGYQPADSTPNGTYHKIEVAVKSRDVAIAARKGYLMMPSPAGTAATAPAPNDAGGNAPSARMRELLASQLPVSGLGLRASGGPVRPEGDKVLTALVLEIDSRSLPFNESNGQLSNDVEIAFVTMDTAGKVYTSSRSVGNLRLAAADRSAIGNGLRYVAEFALPPGRYQVRAGAFESIGGTGGSAILDVDTGEPGKLAISIGSILVIGSPDRAMPTTGNFQILHAVLPGPPTTARDFAPSDTLVAFADVSDKGEGSGHEDEIRATVQDARGHEVFRNATTHQRSELSAKKNGFGYVARVPLSGFSSGIYVLTIDARTPNGKTASRSVGFSVR
jgi:VWFA-related protein